MTALYMVQPSSFMRSMMEMSQLGEIYLFRFNDELQERFETLLQQKNSKISPRKSKLSSREFPNYLASSP